MNRREFLRDLAFLPTASLLLPSMPGRVRRQARVRPRDPGWPSAAEWSRLRDRVGGRLVAVQSPLAEVKASGDKAQADALFKSMKNPYFIGDNAGLTQSTGYIDAWTTAPSVYAIEASDAADIQAGVNFAREHNLRLVVKGGGHSYHGTSCAPDSLLIWTHPMKEITLHDAFVPHGTDLPPTPAVTVGAGCLWIHVYQEVAVKNGRYVQGGGCCTVGVVGLLQGGGFGSWSKKFGTAAASLLEAEIVTADGSILTVNRRNHPDLFWAIKGGGGGNWGVVTKMTLKTHELPSLGGISGNVRAKSDEAFRRLILQFLKHYREHLFNPNWGESVKVRKDNSLGLDMVFQGLSREEAQAAWKPFSDWVKARPEDYEGGGVLAAVIPGRSMWDGDFWKGFYPSNVSHDSRPGAPKSNMMWSGNIGECGVYWHGYESVWMPEALLKDESIEKLAEALFQASRRHQVELHFNKGLAGGSPEAIAASRDTATNPGVLTAFALAIIGDGEDPAYAGIAGHEPHLAEAREQQARIREAMAELRTLIPAPGAYLNECSFHEKDWYGAFWGPHAPRLRAIKKKYDPDGLFFAHHGVGSEAWSEDGFSPK